MTHKQRCQKAATAPACLEMIALILPAQHLDTLRAAYRRVYELSPGCKEWRKAYAEWQQSAARFAIAAVCEVDAQRRPKP